MNDLLTRVSPYINGAQTFQSQYPFPLLQIMEDPKELLFVLVRSVDQSFSTGGHLTMSGDIFGCHNLWGGRGSDTSIQWERPEMLLTVYSAQDSPHDKKISSPKCQ